MTGTLCIYIHLDIGSVYINRMPVRLGPVRVLTAQQFNPSFFGKLTFLVGVGGRIKCLPRGASGVVTPLVRRLVYGGVRPCRDL